MKVGDRVKVKGDYARGQTGTIIEETTNMLGMPLIIVELDPEGREEFQSHSYQPCFYPHEVEKL